MTVAPHRTICRKDYTQPDYLVDTVALRFELDEETTRVQSRLEMKRRPGVAADRPLALGTAVVSHTAVVSTAVVSGLQYCNYLHLTAQLQT